MNLNKAILVGRLTNNPEIKALPSGQKVATFGLATSRFYTDKSGQRQQQADFHNIVLFGRLAEIASQYLTKGAMAMIEGRIQTRSWDDASGVKKYKTEIVGQALQLGPKAANTGEFQKRSPMDNPQNESNNKTGKIAQEDEIPVIEETNFKESEEEINLEDIPF